MPSLLHVCTLPADKRVCLGRLKVKCRSLEGNLKCNYVQFFFLFHLTYSPYWPDHLCEKIVAVDFFPSQLTFAPESEGF